MLLFKLAALAALVSARRIMDTLITVPRGWKEIRKASPDEPIFLRIALKQPRSAALDQAVLDISTPGHPNYGMHMTRKQLRAYTAPSEASVAAAMEWLASHGIKASVDHDWISFTTTVSTANRLLDTQFSWYQPIAGGLPQLRTLSYSVPDHVGVHIDLIQPTTRFGYPGTRKSAILKAYPIEAFPHPPSSNSHLGEKLPNECIGYISPTCLKEMYNVHYRPNMDSGYDNSSITKVAFASFLHQYARYSDLKLFEHAYITKSSSIGNHTFSVELINGGLNDQESPMNSMEANLDAQYLMALSYPLPMIEYSTGGLGPLVPTPNQPEVPGSNEPYLEWLLYLLNKSDLALPQTISVSYGEEEQSVPREYALKVCSLFRDLGARGVSVLFASGDSGPGDACTDINGNSTFFEPTFPGACPWVTSVGGTVGGTGPGDEEKAAGFSSGGFSTIYEQPPWQREVVQKYLASLGKNHSYLGYFNRTGRAFPDISAQSQRFVIYDKGVATLVAGTSASTPVVAGMVGLLNAARKARGKPPLGFLNPWLYNVSVTMDAFMDIKSGYGIGCRGKREFGYWGAQWNATEGWDPVTGLGTPLFDKLLEAAAPGTKNA